MGEENKHSKTVNTRRNEESLQQLFGNCQGDTLDLNSPPPARRSRRPIHASYPRDFPPFPLAAWDDRRKKIF